MKNKKFAVFFGVLISLIITISIINYNRNSYYNNYFYYNEKQLKDLKKYIYLNNILGHIYIYNEVDIYGEFYNDGLKKGELGDCITNNTCKISNMNMLDYLKNININFIGYIDGGLKIKPKKNIYRSEDSFIYYKKGYYQGKKELDRINGNSMHVIEKIFDDNWGVINGCYGCGGGAWD